MASAAKSQSAMEFLMTYGWSILIIAVVLGALFQLGVFSSANLAPRTPAGNCKILRVASTYNLEGSCSGVLPQQVVTANGYGVIMSASTMPKLNQFSMTGWMLNEPPLTGQSGDSLVNIGNSACGIYDPRSASSYGVSLDPCGCYYSVNSLPVGCNTYAYQTGLSYGAWYFLALTVDTNGNVITYAYKSGTTTPTTLSYSIGNAIYSPGSAQVRIGSYGTVAYMLNGSIADVQIYNTSLDASQIQALYLKGIGAAPVDPVHTVGWWPLNGDANDYSGNNNNGAPTNMVYSSSWISSYTPP
jgi:Concanavalin A-like lectin/glucanases superfamily